MPIFLMKPKVDFAFKEIMRNTNVRILMNNMVEIDIEIQLAELKVWTERSLFYLSKIYVE